MTPRLPLALTMGEPAGVGGEIALKAWLGRAAGLPTFVALDDPERLREEAARLNLPVPVEAVEDVDAAAARFGAALPVLPVPLASRVAPGRPDGRNADAVRRSIETAVELALTGRVAGVVTNPVHKRTLLAAGFPYAGHTAFLAVLAGLEPSAAVMMLASPMLRVVPVTVHLGLIEAARSLTTERIVHTCRVADEALRHRFAIAHPRLAVSGLNPHAGEEGTLGREEIDVIAPAVAALGSAGVDVHGPVAADSMFAPHARRRFDAAVCMYHDQALIPIKALDFDRAVNITLGLPFVRTSPDHGTALDIAGRGVASEASLVAAIALAGELAANVPLAAD